MAKRKARIQRRICRCADCGETWSRDPAPMVIGEVWKQLACKPGDFLCEECMHQRFERYLSRPLLFGDLVRCPFNFGWARPSAADDEPVSFWCPYMERWMRQQWENEKLNQLVEPERSIPATKH